MNAIWSVTFLMEINIFKLLARHSTNNQKQILAVLVMPFVGFGSVESDYFPVINKEYVIRKHFRIKFT